MPAQRVRVGLEEVGEVEHVEEALEAAVGVVEEAAATHRGGRQARRQKHKGAVR